MFIKNEDAAPKKLKKLISDDSYYNIQPIKIDFYLCYLILYIDFFKIKILHKIFTVTTNILYVMCT